MSEQINIDGVKFKIGYDSAAVEKGLKDDEKKASEAGKKVGSNFSNAFQAVVGAGAMVGLKAFFSRAESEFNRLEGAMKRVESIAKGFGRNIELAKKNVNELADEGFLNLTQAASGYADAIALGFDEKQARKFIGALSDIAAYQNTIGNGAEAVTSGLAGLLSNSAEKVENIGVPVKILNQEYNKNIATMGKAAALQKFYNGILKESEKFQGDAARSTQTLAGAQASYNAAVEKSMQAIGKGLEPAMRKLYQIGTDLATGFANWFSGLNETTKTVVLLGAAMAAAVPAIAAMIPVLTGFGAALAALALNPVSLTIMAIAAAVGALTIAFANAQPKISETQQKLNEALALRQTVIEMEKAGAAAKDLAAAKSKLAAIEKELNERYRDAIELLKLENAELETKARIIARVEAAETRYGGREGLSAMSDADLRRAIAAARGRRSGGLGEGGGRFAAPGIGTAARLETGSLTVSPELAGAFGGGAETTTTTGEASATFDLSALLAEEARRKRGGKPTTGGGGGKASPEFRFIEARDQLKKLSDEYKNYLTIEKDESKRAEAGVKLASARRAIEADLRGAIAEYNEETVTAQQEAAKREYEDQVKRIYGLANIDENAKKRVAEDLQKAQESYARQNAKIYAESFARTMQGANAIASGFAGALRAQNIGQALGGFGGIAQGIGGLSERFESFGLVGQGIAAAGGIISTLTDLFGKSDAERAREAEEQKRRDEEAKALLELQANYQKSMLALQEAAAKLPFENLTRNLRLVDIQAQQATLAGGDKNAIEAQRLAQRQTLMQGVLTEQVGTIGGGALFGGTGSTPEDLIAFLSQRAAQQPSLEAARNVLNTALGFRGSAAGLSNLTGVLQSQAAGLAANLPPEIYSALMQSLNLMQSAMQNFRDQGYDLGKVTITDIPYEIFGKPFDTLISEVVRDTGTAESLLSVIQDSLANQIAIEENTRKTAENTAKALTLRPDRERSFIDVGRGYIQSLGQRLTNPALAAVAGMDRNIVLPGSIGMASGVATAARTLQERLTDAAEMNVRQNAEMIDILYDARTVLVNMLAALDSDTSTINRLSVAEFDRIQSEVNRRRR